MIRALCESVVEARASGLGGVAIHGRASALDRAIDIDTAGTILAALDDERRQTQRQVIAALYWRAGHAAVMVDEWRSAGNAAGVERAAYEADALTFAARVMEAAL